MGQGAMRRRKGASGEREAAGVLRKLGFSAYRGRQFSGSPDSPDVAHSIPEVHIEVKRCESLSLYPAMDQAEQDAGDDIPIVLHRRNKKQWLVIANLDDLPSLAEAILKALENSDEDT